MIISSKCIQTNGFTFYFHQCFSLEQRTLEFLCNWVSYFPVHHIHPTDLLTYCYVHKVAHLLWIFIEVFPGRKRFGCVKNVCYHCYLSGAFGGVGSLAQYHFCGYMCMCVCFCWGCFLTLIDMSLAVQVHQTLLVWFTMFYTLYLVKKCKKLGR